MDRPPQRGPQRGPRAPQGPSGTISPARRAAFAVLERVGASDAHSDDLLHGPMLAGLSEQDKNLATALVMGVLRWQLVLEARLLPLLSRPDMVLPSPVATALRLGAFQLLYMDRIPAHAALSESVELVRAANQPQAAGMVNAVLRKLAAGPRDAPRKPLIEKVPALAERLGHPEWMVARWVAEYGQPAAEKICEYNLREPITGGLFPEDLGSLRIDDGSRLVAELAVAAAPPGVSRVWDACAAPGGKTQVLARKLEGAEVLATDVSPKRLERMAQRLERELPGRIRTLHADASLLPPSEGSFSLVLCDAPCSGTGTLARNPEIKVRLEPTDLARQVKRQRLILAAALERLEPGGRLVYSTCSLEPEENEQVVAELLHSGGAKIIPVSGLLTGLPVDPAKVVRGQFLRTLPGVFPGDGFFAAVLEKA